MAKASRAGKLRRTAAFTVEAPDLAASAPPPDPGVTALAEPMADAPISLSYRVPAGDIQTVPEAAFLAHPPLTYQQEQVSRIAGENGDRDFLMVDKGLGKILLFQNGKAAFSASALTGASTADRLPPGATTENFAKLNALDTKVTPAGRYTVVRHFDQSYGQLLDIAEIRGKDWGIAIHKVYLGNPAERRQARLLSPSEQDKHITFGCINVLPETIQILMRDLPADRSTPLYILPEDQRETALFFTAHTS